MMYRRKEMHRDLAVLRVSTDVLDLPGAVIADRNAASNIVRFAPSPGGLSRLDYGKIFATYWTHPDDPIEEMEHKSIKCAEVLVPDRVDPVHITGAYVSCEESRRRIVEDAPGLPATVDAHLFFR